MNDLAPSTLLLTGYVSLTGQGLALPCFKASAQSNAWYTANCSVDADHAGEVTGFEVFASNDIVNLSSDWHRAVSVGSPWIDVFLWNENTIVGTPAEIWNGLGEERSEMLSAIPISGLDLALSLQGEEVASLVENTFDFIRARFDEDTRGLWACTCTEYRD